MNEALIKNVIKYKLSAASLLLDRLPPEAAKKVKTFGHVVYEAVGEFEEKPPKEDAAKTGGIPIE
jgi:hypothetical protein